MAINRWYGADDLRESWCLLLIAAAQTNDQLYAQGWAVGDANADQLLDTDHQTISDPSAETELLDSLGEELDKRRYQGITLITPTQQTLQFLRARLFSNNNIPHPTLRGYRHVALSSLIEDYIDLSATGRSLSVVADNPPRSTMSEDAQRNNALDLERVWELTAELVPLVPAAALQGDPL